MTFIIDGNKITCFNVSPHWIKGKGHFSFCFPIVKVTLENNNQAKVNSSNFDLSIPLLAPQPMII